MKTRYFSIMSYSDLNVISERVKDVKIDKWAYIYHDRDENENHTHILVKLKNANSINGAINIFKQEGRNTFAEQIKHDTIYNYLLHEGKNKAQYNENEIKSNDIEYWKKLSETGINENSKITDLINDIIEDKSEREMVMKYGRDYVLNRNKYRNYALVYYNEDFKIKTLEQYNDILLRTNKFIDMINEFKNMNIEDLEIYDMELKTIIDTNTDTKKV